MIVDRGASGIDPRSLPIILDVSANKKAAYDIRAHDWSTRESQVTQARLVVSPNPSGYSISYSGNQATEDDHVRLAFPPPSTGTHRGWVNSSSRSIVTFNFQPSVLSSCSPTPQSHTAPVQHGRRPRPNPPLNSRLFLQTSIVLQQWYSSILQTNTFSQVTSLIS